MQEVQDMRVWSLDREDPLEEMATHSGIFAWETPWTEEPITKSPTWQLKHACTQICIYTMHSLKNFYFTFGSAGSSSLHVGFLCLWWVEATLLSRCMGFSLRRPLLSTALGLFDSVFVQGVSCSATCGIFQTRDWTCVRCIGRQILNRWAIREVPDSHLLVKYVYMCVKL